ncbi:MAG: NADH-quinone oxidoreductase subunit N [Cystobacterineae bacterium]|nr:NADH-quinone oxidoreductase subunit N [Cystobacterineae bacterium]
MPASTVVLPSFSFHEFQPLLPAALLAITAMLLMLTEAFSVSKSRSYQAILAVVASAVAGFLAFQNTQLPAGLILNGRGVMDGFSSWITLIACLAAGMSSLLALGFFRQRNAERGEFYGLLLFSAAGMSLLSVSNEFVTLFVNLELMSLATYALAAFWRRGNRSVEAGFKYFILGAFASAILIYGVALLYGATGTTQLDMLYHVLPKALEDSPWLVWSGIILVLTGLSFKIAAVPLHMWTPDVYEGAPTPVTALMSAGIKAAAFVALLRVILHIGDSSAMLLHILCFLAALTMVVGNLLAIAQRNVKRMLAYSSIAHAGYILIGVAALFAGGHLGNKVGVLSATQMANSTAEMLRSSALQGILFYLLSYAITVVGAFGVLAAIERREDDGAPNAWDLSKLSGLATRRPGWALAMALFMFSLGGIPSTIGFLAKLYLFKAGMSAGLIGLSILGVLASAAGMYYYLRVIVYMYMRPPTVTETGIRHWSTEFILAVSAVAVIVLGILPGPLLDWLSQASLFSPN